MAPRATSTKRRFNEDKAQQALEFFPKHLSLVKGRYAGQPFKLHDFQADPISEVFGREIYDRELKLWVREIRTVYEEIPRKNAKSTKGAGLGLKLSAADGEMGAEVYSVAEDVDQANKVFSVAQRMVETSPTLSKRAKVYKRLIEFPKTGNVYRVIPGDAAGNLGHDPHGVIFDELLTQKTRELWDVMTSGQGTRSQPLTWAFSTAGRDRNSICWELHDYGERIRKGLIEDPSFLYIRYGIEEGDDWEDEEVWKRCNPALGKFLLMSFLRSEYRKAKQTPARQNAFRNFYLNEWTAQETRWMDLKKWDESAGLVDETKLKGRACFGGLDLATSTDVAALCWDFPSDGEHDAIWRFFVPEDRIADLDKRTGGKASVWVRDGFLKTTEGDVIDYKAILKQIDDDARNFDVRELAYDRWGATQLAQDLQDAGMNVIPFGQGFASMSGPTKEFERLVLQKKYRHGGNPVMRWMVDNIIVRQDPAGNIKIDKGKSHEKVDGPVAAVMALARATVHEDDSSVYQTRGLVTL